MTPDIQVNSTGGTIKVEKQHILQLMSWSEQPVDLNPIEVVWFKFTAKLELNNHL